MSNRYDILEIAQRLGLNVVRGKALCPMHGDRHPSLSFKGNRFRCWACGCHGDAIDLVRQVLKLGYADAVAWIEGSGISLCNNTFTPPPPQPAAELGRYEYMFSRPIITHRAEMFLFGERQLDRSVIANLRISSNHESLAIPYFGTDGQLLSLQWRYLGCDKAIARFTFAHGCRPTIYNLPALSALSPNEALYISEGCSDCWALLSAGHKAIAIPSATLLRSCADEHIEILRHHPHLHIYPDADLPGENLYLQLKQQLPQLIKHTLPSGCKDFSDYYKQSKMGSEI